MKVNESIEIKKRFQRKTSLCSLAAKLWFPLDALLQSILLVQWVFFFLLLLFPLFQYCFDMLRIQTLQKDKGVHILFLLTLFPFLILLGFCNSGYLHDSLRKRRKTLHRSSVLLKVQLLCSWALSWPLSVVRPYVMSSHLEKKKKGMRRLAVILCTPFLIKF